STGEPKAELGTPQAFLDNPVFQSRRVSGHRSFQPSDFAVRVMKRNTHKRLAEVHNTSEPVRGFLIVVMAPYPLSSFPANPLNLVQVPIEGHGPPQNTPFQDEGFRFRWLGPFIDSRKVAS